MSAAYAVLLPCKLIISYHGDNSVARMKTFLKFQSVLLRPFTRRPFPFLAIRRSQTEAQSAFFNLKGQSTLFVIVGLAAALRVLCRKCRQPLFEGGVVGLHLDHSAMLIKIDHRCLLLLGKPCSYKTSRFSQFFLSSWSGKVKRFFDRNVPNDAEYISGCAIV